MAEWGYKVKKVGVALLVSVALGSTGTAAAATPNQRIAKLERTVRAQQNQLRAQAGLVAALNQRLLETQNRLLTVERDLRQTVNTSKCGLALAWDGVLTAYLGVNIVAQEAGRTPVFTIGPRVNDEGACAAIGISRSAASFHALRRGGA